MADHRCINGRDLIKGLVGEKNVLFLFLKSENSNAQEANWGTALPDHISTITLDLGGCRPAATMIRAVIVMNTQGKPRLLKFYEFQVP